MTSEQAIEQILKDQISTYKSLKDILGEERRSLVDIDVENIEKISKEKDTLIMRLRLLEEERQRLLTEFTATRDVPMDINLKQLSELTGNEIFFDLRSQLLSLLQSIDELNKFNSLLIDKSLRYYKTTTNFINSFQPGNMAQSSGVLFSKET